MDSSSVIQEWSDLFNLMDLVDNKVDENLIDNFILNHPGFDIDVRFETQYNSNALEIALACLNVPIARKLLELGADYPIRSVNKFIGFLARNEINHSLPESEYQQRRLELLELMLSYAQAIARQNNRQNNKFEEAFTIAANNNDIPFITLLIAYGTSPNRNRITLQPVRLKLETVKLLLKNGLDPFQDKDGALNNNLFVQSVDLKKLDFIQAMKDNVPDELFVNGVNKELHNLLLSPVYRETTIFILNLMDEYSIEPHPPSPDKHISEKVHYLRFCIWLSVFGLDQFLTMDIARTLCLSDPFWL